MSLYTVEAMVDWVEQHLGEVPTLDAMAESVGYSSCYCSAKFHEHVGVSFQDYLNRRRLSQAAVALQETKARIIDIAADWGFSSHEAFTRAFFRAWGYTPRQYRRLLPELRLYPKAALTTLQ